MNHNFPIQKKDHTVNQWLILCSLYAIDYASENILDDKDIKFATRNRFNSIKTFAQNTLNNCFHSVKNKPLSKNDIDFIVYDHVVMMQKLFMCACAIPEDKLSYFLDTVTKLSSEIVYNEIEKNTEIE